MEGLISAIDANRLHVLKYEKLEFQQKVVQTLPLERLKETALKSGQSKGLTFHEHFLKEVSVDIFVLKDFPPVLLRKK